MKRKNEAGNRYGKWTVLSLDRIHQTQGAIWLCRCDCGIERRVPGRRLRGGRSQSCGCGVVRAGRPPTIAAQGGIHAPEYHAWSAMLQRCENPKNPRFIYYGARGITVCERWHTFNAFYEDMGPRPSPELSIDRINNDGNYEPGNCRWATAHEQRINQRPGTHLNPDSLSGQARAAGIDPGLLRARLRRGLSLGQALSRPKGARTNGLNLNALARKHGISRQLLDHRLNVQGLSLDEALTRPVGPTGRRC